MCGSAPAPPPQVIMPPAQPDNSAQLNALAMQNQSLQDQLNEMQQAQTQSIVQNPPTMNDEIMQQQQTAPDTQSMGDAAEARRGKRGRKSLRIRRKAQGASGGVNVPGGSPTRNAPSGNRRSGGPRLPKY